MRGSMGKSGNFALLSSDKLPRFFSSRVESRLWWVIIPRGRAGHDLVQSFEAQFYGGDKNAGFEVMVFPLSALREGWSGAIMVAFALRQYCSPSKFADWLIRHGHPTTAEALVGEPFHLW
jgi:hypothetical protein